MARFTGNVNDPEAEFWAPSVAVTVKTAVTAVVGGFPVSAPPELRFSHVGRFVADQV